jgi:hypothetical protein
MFYLHRIVVVLVITLSYDCFVQGFLCLAVSLMVSSSQKFLVVLVGMLRLNRFSWSTLLIEAADCLSLIMLLVYAYHPSLEDSLKLLNVFYGLIYSLMTVSLVSTVLQLVVYCRRPRLSKLELL